MTQTLTTVPAPPADPGTAAYTRGRRFARVLHPANPDAEAAYVLGRIGRTGDETMLRFLVGVYDELAALGGKLRAAEQNAG